MATQIQWRRGTTAQTASFTGAVGEATVDTSKNTLVIHDGTTAGGFPLARESALSANVAQIQASFNQANTAFIAATSAGIYANGAFVSSNTIQTYVTSANANISLLFSYVNTANANITAAFAAANAATATDTTQNNSITAAFTQANTGVNNALSASNYANGAFTKANNSLDRTTGGSISGTIGVSGNVYAGNVIANTAFTSLAGSSKLQLSDIGLVTIDVAGVQTKFGASGIESSPGIYGGSFGGNKLSLNSETNLISNRGDVVKIQTGTDGTTVNDFTFANNAFTVPGRITSGSVVTGGINVVPTLVASFSTANAAFTRANNSINANTGGTITGDLIVTGNLTISGTTTYANTQQLLVGDNLITLNAELPTSVTPVENAGIEINRGNTFANASLLWVESAGKWQANTGSATGAYFIANEASATSAGVYANGAFAVANNAAGVNLTQNTSITSAFVQANSAYIRANNSLNANTGGTIAGPIVVDGGTYGNVTTTQFASVYGQAYGPNAYSIMQVRSSDFATGMGIQVYAGLNGLLYSNTGIQFNTGSNVRDKDYPTGGTNAGQFAANGAFIAQASLASTSNTTGSIQVAGGVGVKGNVYADSVYINNVIAATIGDALALSIALG
jgi:hypothetical protein